jgi:hypothetical protein
LSEIRRAEKMKINKTSEKLPPEINKSYLCWDEFNNEWFVLLYEGEGFDGNGLFFDFEYGYASNVTYWAELPPPPVEDIGK